MKIAIEARVLARHGSGIRTYVSQLIKHLGPLTSDLTVISDLPPRLEWLLPYWLNHHVPRQLKDIGANVAHFTKSAVPRRKVCPTIVTIYDVIPLLYKDSQKLPMRWYWPRTLRHAAEQADHIMTISEASRRDIEKYLDVRPEKITVTPLAVDTETFQPVRDESKLRALREKYDLKKPYILWLGTIEPRKNVPALIRAFNLAAVSIPHDLIIAGGTHKDSGTINAALAQSPAGRVHQLGFIETSDLPALYSAADLFVWPSIYEGWGLPPAESMACGTPVIVSDGGSLPEVVGDCGVTVNFSVKEIAERLFDSDFEKRLSETIIRVLLDLKFRGELAAGGLVRAKQNTWSKVAADTLAIYKKYATA